MNQILRGTSAQLAGRLVLNGQRLDQPAISFLTRIFEGAGVKKIDTVRTSTGRGGKPATVWEFDPSQFKLDMKMGRKTRSANDADNGNETGTNGNETEPKRRPGRPSNAERGQAQAQGGDLAQAIGAAIAQQMGPIVDKLDKLTETMNQPQGSTSEPEAGSESGNVGEASSASGGENGNGNETGTNGNGTAASKTTAASKSTASKSASASKAKGGSKK